MESDLLLRLQMEDLQKRLDEKENMLTEAQEATRILKCEVQSLRKQLGVTKRKYLDLLEKQPQTSIRPDSEVGSKICTLGQNGTEAGFSLDAVTQNQPMTLEYSPLSLPVRTDKEQTEDCVGDQPTLILFCESEPNPTSDPSGQRSPSPALSCVSELSPSPLTHRSCVDDAVEGDGHITVANGKAEQHRLRETETSSMDLPSNTEKSSKALSLKIVSVRLKDCRHKLGPNGFYIVQGLADDDDDDEGESYPPGASGGPCALSSEEKVLEFRQKSAFQCNKCTKTFSQSNCLKLHQRTHGKKRQAQPGLTPVGHKCGTCGKKFPHRSVLLIHERVHTGEKPYVCTVCGRAFSQLGNLKLHHSKHQEKALVGDAGAQAPVEVTSSSTRFLDDKHKCVDCGKGFPFRSLLRLHQRTHTGERPYACSTCGRTFSLSGNLRTHMQMHEDHNGPSKGVGAVKTAAPCAKPHKCTECDKAFDFQAQLQLHLRKHASEKLYEKPYSCTLCEKKFSRPESYRNHKQWHAKELRYRCSHCRKAFVTPSKLKQHMIKHTGEKPFSCPQCSKNFTSSSGLKKHSQIHTGEMPYRCSTCDKAFTFQSNLRAHERTHTQERPYLCHLCGKTFTDSSSLSRHQKTHTDERPHACPHCGRKFLKATNLRRHLLQHTGQRPHLCAVCGKAFSRSEILKTHQRVHTGEKPYQCAVCGERFAYVQSLQSHHKREHLTHKHLLTIRSLYPPGGIWKTV